MNVDADGVEGYLWAEVLRLALCAGSGRVGHLGILARGCRGALVIDAADRGVIAREDGGLQFDADAAGPGLLTELVDELEGHPRRPLAVLMQRGRPHLSVFVDELVGSGVWRRHGVDLGSDHTDYRDTDAARFQQMRAELDGTATARFVEDSPHGAALVALATVLNLQCGKRHSLREPSQQIIEACGSLSWIVSEVTDYLLDAQRIDLAAGDADGFTNSAQLFTN